ncbi:MAG: heavy metal-associated domain-containing protein [Chloroflexota bacterium]|nr:heavy metal-associated domain-containing protein [Chloroflexota bacterium]
MAASVETKSFFVPNIGCDGCVRTIVSELSAQDGVVKVEGDVASKRVTIQWHTPMTWDSIVGTLEKIEYSPAEPLLP